MTTAISLSEKELGARLRADAKGAPRVVFRAIVSASHRGRAFLVQESPVDRGILRNAWKIIRLDSLGEVHLVNDQPYAGIVEQGARPFKTSPEGFEALQGWVMRKRKSGEIVSKYSAMRTVKKRGFNRLRSQAKGESTTYQKRILRATKAQIEKEAKGIAFAISKKFEKVGMKGKRFVMKNLVTLANLMDREIKRYLSKFFNRPLRGSK